MRYSFIVLFVWSGLLALVAAWTKEGEFAKLLNKISCKLIHLDRPRNF